MESLPGPVISSIIGLGPPGIAIACLAWYISVLHKDIKEERKARAEDADKFRALVLEMQEKVITTCHRFADVVESVIEVGKRK